MPLNYGDPLASYSQPDAPLAMRMMENLPGITASVGFSSMRGSNTLIRGGFFDDAPRFAKSRARFGVFQGGSLTPTAATSESFLFGKRRSLTNRAGRLRDPFAKPSRLNNITMRPRAISRMHSLSVMTAAEGSGLYTFAQGHRLLNRLPMKSFRAAVGAPEGVNLFGPGLISSISAGRKLDMMTKTGKLSGEALEQLGLNVKRLATANNPALLKSKAVGAAFTGPRFAGEFMMPASERLALARSAVGPASFVDEGMAALRAGGEGARGVGGNLMASSMAGVGTRFLAGYFRGAQGFAGAAGLQGNALAGAQKAVQHLTKALQAQGLKRSGAIVAARALEQGVFKTLGPKRAIQAGLTTRTGAAVLGARGLGLALPGLQVVAAASLLYDLGRMGGEVIKSGINLARDASISLQGSINKPMFGMGYRDTELAATSRARGVMAIQNSRLNARSALGSEAAMMAAHFG